MERLSVLDFFMILSMIFMMMAPASLTVDSHDMPPNIPMDKSTEADLPKIQLPKGSTGGVPAGKSQPFVSISARKDGNDIRYYIGDLPIGFEDIPDALRKEKDPVVKIRFDEKIPYGHYVKMLEVCKTAGVSQIINVYTVDGKEG